LSPVGFQPLIQTDHIPVDAIDALFSLTKAGAGDDLDFGHQTGQQRALNLTERETAEPAVIHSLKAISKAMRRITRQDTKHGKSSNLTKQNSDEWRQLEELLAVEQASPDLTALKSGKQGDRA
jgi:hypothetical protein